MGAKYPVGPVAPFVPLLPDVPVMPFLGVESTGGVLCLKAPVAPGIPSFVRFPGRELGYCPSPGPWAFINANRQMKEITMLAFIAKLFIPGI